MLALALCLAVVPAPQEYEVDLRFDQDPQWWEGGRCVEVSGDWIGVNGGVLDAGTGLLDRGVRLFRRGSGGRWNFARTLLPSDPYGAAGETGFGIDGEHLVMRAPQAVHTYRFDPALDDWLELPAPALPPVLASATVDWWFQDVLLAGDLMVAVSFGTDGLTRRTLHTYAYDSSADTWVWQDDLVGPAGADGFGVWSGLDGTTLVTNGMFSSANFGELDEFYVYGRTAAGWSLSQTVAGSSYSNHPYGFGAWMAFGGDVLVVPNITEALVFERPAPGAPFAQVDAFPCDVVPEVAVDGSTIVYTEPDGRIGVRRMTPCSSGAWALTHRLNSIHLHDGFGYALAVEGDDVVQGAPGCDPSCSPRRTGQASLFHVAPDLNQDGIVDACQTGAFEDVDQDGLFDIVESPGSRFCSPNVPTSLGAPAQILLEGSEVVSENELYVRMLGVPQGSFGLMLASRSFGLVPNAGGSDGNLCLTGHIGRRYGETWSTYFSTPNNELVKRFDLSYSPTDPSSAMLAGETWYFQGWFRDAGSSNFTDAMRLYLE